MATVMNCGACLCDCFQGIGFSPHYYEVGGPDTAILTSVGNVRPHTSTARNEQSPLPAMARA